MIENITPKFSKKPIKIVGCGLAGAEIAFILANNGFDVHIFDSNFEDKKERNVISHAEIAPGIDKSSNQYVDRRERYYNDIYDTYLTDNMKYELECLNSPLISVAKRYDFNDFGFVYDDNFMSKVKELLLSNSKIKIFNMKIDTINETETTVIATGHNTDKKLLDELEKYVGKFHICYFQPEKMVIDATTVDLSRLNFVSDNVCYINLSEEEYNNVYKTIIELDKEYVMPSEIADEKQISIENTARRGQGGLRNAIFRPYFNGEISQQKRPYASLKCSYNEKENVLIFEEFFSAFDDEDQEKIIKNIDVLKNCQVVRFSKIKRKTFLLTPTCLNQNLQILGHENVYVCGGLAGLADAFEVLLMANYCAYTIIAERKNKLGVELLRDKTCISVILDNLLKKSVVNFRLFNLKYDIINKEDKDLQLFSKQVEVQKFLSKSQIEKFKEKFYGKYF